MRPRSLLGLALSWVLAARAVHAEEPVALELLACPFIDANEVRRVMQTELGGALSRLGSKPRVTARCDGDRVSLQVAAVKSPAPLTRSFTLGEPRDAGVSRLIGIAAAELILESQEDGPAESANGAVRATPPPGLATRAPEPRVFDDADRLGPKNPRDRHESHLRLVGLASLRTLFAYEGALWGGAVRLEAEPLDHLSWATDVSFERGQFNADETRFAVETWTVGAHLFYVQKVAPFLLRAGGGLRAGFASSSPTSDPAQDTGVLASWGWPLLALNVSLRLGASLVVELSSEASYVVLPVSARGSTLRGLWLGNQLGLGYVF